MKGNELRNKVALGFSVFLLLWPACCLIAYAIGLIK
jgi:hypothetical protein